MKSPKLNRNLRLLVLVRAFSTSNIYTVFFVFYLVSDLHTSPGQAIEIFSALGLLSVAFDLPTGRFADRYGHRRSLIIGSGCCISGLVVYATATAVDIWFGLGAVLAYAGWSLLSGADSALASHLCDAGSKSRGEAAKAYARFEAQCIRVSGLCGAAGSLLGALLVELWGLRSTLWVQAAAYGLMLVCVCFISSSPRKPVVHPGVVKLLRSLRKRRRLMLVFVWSAAIATGTGMASRVFPVYYTHLRWDGEALPAGGLGVLWAIVVAAPMLLRPHWHWSLGKRWKMPRYYALLSLFLVGSGCFAVMALTASAGGVVALIVIFMLPGLQTPSLLLILQEHSSSLEHAQILSLLRSSRYIAMSLGGVLVGTLTEGIGLSAGLLAGAALLGGLGALAWRDGLAGVFDTSELPVLSQVSLAELGTLQDPVLSAYIERLAKDIKQPNSDSEPDRKPEPLPDTSWAEKYDPEELS